MKIANEELVLYVLYVYISSSLSVTQPFDNIQNVYDDPIVINEYTRL